MRELEKREREREAKMERERLEKQRAAEQAVHKHFEESLRLAQQKVSQSETALRFITTITESSLFTEVFLAIVELNLFALFIPSMGKGRPFVF